MRCAENVDSIDVELWLPMRRALAAIRAGCDVWLIRLSFSVSWLCKRHTYLPGSDCLRFEDLHNRTLIHIIFARDPKRPDFRLQVSHYCLLQDSATQHFAFESNQANKRRATHQLGTTVRDCKEKWNPEPCRVNGENIKVYEDGIHIGWMPREWQVLGSAQRITGKLLVSKSLLPALFLSHSRYAFANPSRLVI